MHAAVLEEVTTPTLVNGAIDARQSSHRRSPGGSRTCTPHLRTLPPWTTSRRLQSSTKSVTQSRRKIHQRFSLQLSRRLPPAVWKRSATHSASTSKATDQQPPAQDVVRQAKRCRVEFGPPAGCNLSVALRRNLRSTRTLHHLARCQTSQDCRMIEALRRRQPPR